MTSPLSPRHLILTALVAIVSMVGLMGVGVMVAPSASALDCGGIETSIIGGDICDGASKDSNDSSENPIISVITFVLQILTGAVGIAAVGALVWAGIMYASAGGESGQVQKAKTVIRDTVIGIVVYSGMILILNFVIPGGVFGQQSSVGKGTTATPQQDDTSVVHGGDLTVATYNIRSTSLNRWDSTRANSILSYMKTVDVVGVQEGKINSDASKNSIGWLQSKLGSAGYGNYAAERGGEWRTIFWKNSKFELVDKGSYNIDSNRNLAWVKLKLKSSGTVFYFMTTHLDYIRCKHDYGVNTTKDCVVREKQAKSISDYVSSHIKSAPVIFVGDMNSYTGSTADKAFQKGGFKDAYSIAKKKIDIRSSIIDNFNGGTTGTLKTGGKPIDHIYVKNGITNIPRVQVTKHKGSDHVPVEADITLPGSGS